ncbi:MAG: DUF2946 family protein [Burkholderiales bacterium]|nr:DUF2946 family protein [Burkholderiales bacterium]
MDDIVKQAMAKWPNVPDCYGWLGLDARGDWYMRDDRVQALGGFASGAAGAKGSRLLHDKLIAFIQRNYQADAQGRWFFQNGPQRVYVELEVAPWVWRVQSDLSVQTHTGEPTVCSACLVDEHGWLYLETPLGLGLVHTQDVGLAAKALESGRWTQQTVLRADLPTRYHYMTSPAQESKVLQKA